MCSGGCGAGEGERASNVVYDCHESPRGVMALGDAAVNKWRRWAVWESSCMDECSVVRRAHKGRCAMSTASGWRPTPVKNERRSRAAWRWCRASARGSHGISYRPWCQALLGFASWSLRAVAGWLGCMVWPVCAGGSPKAPWYKLSALVAGASGDRGEQASAIVGESPDRSSSLLRGARHRVGVVGCIEAPGYEPPSLVLGTSA